MREYHIGIEPFEYTAVQDIKITRAVNEHAEASVTVQIRDGREEEYLGMLAGETWVRIIGTSGQDGAAGAVHTVLFHGIVTDFSFSHDSRGTTMYLALASGTVLMDMEPHFRVFQNENALCASIHEGITGAYPDGRATCTEGGSDRTRGILIQYRETDWEFLKRMAAASGRCLVPDALQKGVRYTVGLPEGTGRDIPADHIRTRLDMREYMEKTRGGMTWLCTGDMPELVVTDREICRIGDRMSYQGREYHICRIETAYRGGECLHTYHLRRKEALSPLPVPHGSITGCSFDASVTGVQRDRVQVEIAGDEWNARDGKAWFPYATVYSSPDGTGWYCMPEIGDMVRLHIPAHHEEQAYVASAVHLETAGAERSNPDIKRIMNKHRKEIRFTPDSIVLTNNRGTRIALTDQNGIEIVSEHAIALRAREDLTLSSETGSLTAAGTESVNLRQKNTGIDIGKGISFTGGEMRVQ